TFTSASSVNGGGGTNELEIQANGGVLLGTGVGPNITNIQVVEHTGTLTSALSVDASHLGSAPEFDLAGIYGLGGGAFGVSVTNLTNTQTVLFEGSGGNLTLAHATPVPLLAQINFTMAADAESPAGALTLNSLHVAAGNGVLNINSIGTASDNVIKDVS